MKKLVFFFFTIILFSCASRKDIVYYQNVDNLSSEQKSNSYDIKIQPDDLLSITIAAEDPEIAMPFNIQASASKESLNGPSYLVDSEGNIEFPILGKMKVSGLSRKEFLNMFRSKIEVYIKNPMINFRIVNFKISLQGEVLAPGTYDIVSERITLIEALAKAKDLTIYGKRDNILIIREINGVKSFNRVDITQADFINSPFYYLAQNDVVYVEPNKNRINGAAVGPNIGIVLSIATLLFTLIITRIK